MTKKWEKPIIEDSKLTKFNHSAYSFVNKDVPDNEIWTIISLVSNLKFTNNTF